MGDTAGTTGLKAIGIEAWPGHQQVDFLLHLTLYILFEMYMARSGAHILVLE